MANSILEQRHLQWQGIVIAAGLTIALSILSGLIASLMPAPTLLLVLATIAFLAVGFGTMQFRSASNPLEPAIGGAATVLVFSLIQLGVAPEAAAELSAGQIALSVLVSILFAFSLAWLGARLGLSMRSRRSPPQNPYPPPSSY